MMKRKLNINVETAHKRSRAHVVLFADSRFKQRTVKSEREYERSRQKAVDRRELW
jgi:hypothetical protein